MLDGPSYQAPQQGDNVRPIFYMKPVRNNFRSDQEGRDIWEDVPYVEIMIPGDKLSEVHEKVKQHHKERWPHQWAAFEANQTAPEEGTPLGEWPPISRSMALELSSNKVRTVEELAGLSDNQLSKVMPMGGNALRDKARAWLNEADGLKAMSEMQQQVDQLKAQNEALQRQMADLASKKPEQENV